MTDLEKSSSTLGPTPRHPSRRRRPRTLDEALDRLAYGDRGVIDPPALLSFIREQIDAAVSAEREACALLADAYHAGASTASDGGQRAAAARRIGEAIRARGDQ